MSTQRLRSQAMQIFRAALAAADPDEAVRRHLRVEAGHLLVAQNGKEVSRYELSSFDRVFVAGAGKASAEMARAIEKLLSPRSAGIRIAGGLINVKAAADDEAAVKRTTGRFALRPQIRLHPSGHPMPDRRGMEGARAIAAIARACGPRDLLICLISGGASALMPLPAPGITLSEKRAVTKLLLASGATIHEINCVRKHISQIKGGQLARLAHPAQVLTLILSDVVGDDLDVIGSGPTVPDASTFNDARAVLASRGIWKSVPGSVRYRLEAGVTRQIPQNPGPGDPVFCGVQNVIVGSNRLALEAALSHAKLLGFQALLLSSLVEGETRDAGLLHAAIAREIAQNGHPVGRPACVISGGETTVVLRGKGKGGRNQEFVLAAVGSIAGLSEMVIFSAGTDGTDGPTDAAGAVADGQTLARAQALGVSDVACLQRNDSYNFFAPLKDLVITGPTGTNVMDIHLVLAGK